MNFNMEKIIELLQLISNDDKNSNKVDVVCALGAVKSLLKNKIDKIEQTDFKHKFVVGQKFIIKLFIDEEHSKNFHARFLKNDYISDSYVFVLEYQNFRGEKNIRIQNKSFPINDFEKGIRFEVEEL